MSYRLDIDPEDRRGQHQRSARSRRMTMIIATLLIAAAAGGAWATYRGLGKSGAPGSVPVIHADARPVKTAPNQPGGMVIPNQNTIILNQDHVVDPKVEQLLPPPEAPLPRPAPALEQAATAAPPPAPPAVPDTPTASTTPLVPPPPAPPLPQPPQVAVAPPPQPAPPPAVDKAPRPSAPVTASAGGYRLQLGAVRSHEAAQQASERLKRAQPDLLGALPVATMRVDLGARGIFYRILAGPIADAAAAERICSELKRRNQGCILVKP